MKNKNLTTTILWAVYLALLAVLFPHTAWLFLQFEQPGSIGLFAACAGALAFEASIAALTHKLSRRIEKTPKKATTWGKFQFRYLNAYAAGLIIAVGVSALANLAHAVQFGNALAIFTAWGIPPMLYQVSFGAVLPLVSLLFASVLSNEVEEAESEDPVLTQARQQAAELRNALQAERRTRESAEKALTTEREKFATAAAKFAGLFESEKRARIIAARQAWPELPAASIAILTESSPAHVSEVLSKEQAQFVEAAGKAKVKV